MYIKNTDFLEKLFFLVILALGESFMMNDWDTPDLTSFLTFY